MDLTGFVLAGGRSTRMGTDKAMLDWHGRTLLDHMVTLLRSVAHPVLVAGREQLPDLVPGNGPLSGIATGLEVTFTDASLFVAVDLPLLTEEFLNYLKSRIENSAHPLVTCKIGSAFPLCLGMWRPMLPEIKRREKAGQFSIRGLVESVGSEIILEHELTDLGFDLSMFLNINTVDDYKAARLL